MRIIMKKIIIIFVILNIIMTILPQKLSFAANSEEEDKTWLEEYPEEGTKGLTYAQQTYISRYVRAYMQEKDKQSPVPLVYNAKTPTASPHYIYEGLYQQNNQHYVVSQLTNNGKFELVCSSFTASMLHQALGIDFESYKDSNPDYTGVQTIRGAGYAEVTGRGKDYFNDISGSDYLQPGDIISYSDWKHSMIYIGQKTEDGYHQVAQTYRNRKSC